MDFNEYQTKASTTATFEGKQNDYKLMYLALGIAGESGEVAEKIKKLMRNDNGELDEEKRVAIKHELGDVLWYLSQMARVLGYTFEEVAEANLSKLADRKNRGVIKSEGDNR